MEPLDAAFQAFRAIRAEVDQHREAIETEADSRLKVIDRVFITALAWPFNEILTENYTPAGFADYAFGNSGRTRLIVEAKRDGLSLGIENREAGRPYTLNGAAFRGKVAQEGIGQAVRYCGEKNAELACVTNGREWIVFRGNRLGDGIDTRSGAAYVFTSLNAIEERFELFFRLLSYESSRTNAFRPAFREAEGLPIRMSVFNQAVRHQGSARFLAQSKLAADIEKIMSTFFKRLTGDDDPELLEACFVETAESRHAQNQLARITESLAARVRDLETGTGALLSEVLKRTTETHRHEFVILVGQKGAGKSTFVSRFFRTVLHESLAKQCQILKIDMASNPGDKASLVEWLDRALVAQGEKVIFRNQNPTFDELTGAFYDEYTRLKVGPWAALYKRDHDQFLINFGDRLESMRNSEPHRFLEILLRNVVTGRQQIPVLIFDNTDHFDIEFQQTVYQYARSLYEHVVCLVVLPITDRTSWQLSKHGALQSFDHESFFLPTPETRQILRKRIEFVENRIDYTDLADSRYFVKRGISMTIRDLGAFTKALQQIFLQSSSTADQIGELANYDVRRALNLAASLISSPHLRVQDLVSSFLSGTAVSVSETRTERALILGRYDVYPVGMHDFVQNMYALSQEHEVTPLLGIRLLQAMADVPRDEHEGALVDIQTLIGYVEVMDIDRSAIELWLDSMLKTGLCIDYDPTIQSVSKATRVELSPAGRLHLAWAKDSFEYVAAMAIVTPLLEEPAHRQISSYFADRRWRLVAASFIDYLLSEDGICCRVPDHPGYSSQTRLKNQMSELAARWRRPKADRRIEKRDG